MFSILASRVPEVESWQTAVPGHRQPGGGVVHQSQDRVVHLGRVAAGHGAAGRRGHAPGTVGTTGPVIATGVEFYFSCWNKYF